MSMDEFVCLHAACPAGLAETFVNAEAAHFAAAQVVWQWNAGRERDGISDPFDVGGGDAWLVIRSWCSHGFDVKWERICRRCWPVLWLRERSCVARWSGSGLWVVHDVDDIGDLIVILIVVVKVRLWMPCLRRRSPLLRLRGPPGTCIAPCVCGVVLRGLGRLCEMYGRSEEHT